MGGQKLNDNVNLMHYQLEQIVSEQQSELPKEPEANHNHHLQAQPTQSKPMLQPSTISVDVNSPITNPIIQKPYQLRLPTATKHEEQTIELKPHKAKKSKILIEKTYQLNQQQLSLKQKSSNVLKLFDLQDQGQEIEEVCVVKENQIEGGTTLQTISLQINYPSEQTNQKQHEDQEVYDKVGLLQNKKETVEKETETNAIVVPQVKESTITHIRYNAWQMPQVQNKKEEQLNKRSRLFDLAIASQANLKKGLFFQQRNNDQDYVVIQQINSRSQLDTLPQLASSRDEFSSREILDNKSLIFQEKQTRNRITESQSFLNPTQNKIFELKQAQTIENVPQIPRRRILLKNGKFTLPNQEIQDPYQFILNPLVFDRTLQSTIIRNKACQKLCYIDYDFITNEGRYLLSCKKMPFHLTSTYHISLMRNQFDLQSENFTAKIQANFFGTIFNIYTPKTQHGKDSKDLELSATVYYSPQFTCCKPTAREIEVYIKSKSCHFQELQGSGQKGSNLKQLYRLTGNRQNHKIKKFVNKKPIWRQYLQTYVLNFRGKSKMGSVKNTILVNAEDQRQEALLLAKSGTNEFSLDLSHPFSPLVGFAVAMTSFDFKLASQ